MAKRSPLAEKLGSLAEKARQFQLESGTTAPSLDHLAANRKTVRQTISLVLTAGKRRDPVFIFHKEPMPQKKPAPGEQAPPPTFRAAVFGGGVESAEERKLRDAGALIADPKLLDGGKYPADAWYRLLGKHFLEAELREKGAGGLLQMTYPPVAAAVQEFIQDELGKRLRMEAGAATKLIGKPVALAADPVETAVLHRRLGDYTEAIAAAAGMEVNKDQQLVGIGILVQERFAMAELLGSPQQFAARSQGNALVWDADHLVANAEHDTKDLAAWKARQVRQGNDKELPIRNHSLLLGAAAAAQHLHDQSGVVAGAARLWRRVRRRGLAVT